MLRFIACALIVAVSSSFANAEHPSDYWDKIYNTGYPSVANYAVTVQVKNVATAAAEADQRITKAGGSLTNMNSSGAYDQSGRQMRTFTYSIASKSAEALAKTFFSLGDLINFNATHNTSSKDADEIRDKLKELAAEKDGNADCLAKMPIATHLLEGRITQLKQALTAIESRGDKATLTLSLVEPAPKAPK